MLPCTAKVKQLLCSHQSELLQYLLEQESADPLISQLMSVIISRCRETDPIIRLALAECIGELGAIDNGRYTPIRSDNFTFPLLAFVIHSKSSIILQFPLCLGFHLPPVAILHNSV
ncbi:serine/threonine-protein kinase atr-like [Tachypleus tridentatus]|uniref:serine/threonine-protein kinase atr-like n=1 Tax=Tachypleus tridentatus TaxID=6853 RepID=UPI003FD3D746